jgi:ferredoxin
MAKQKKVIHYRDNCIGCGNCEVVCPKYWKMNGDDGKVDLLNSELVKTGIYKRKMDIEDEKDLLESADLCPVKVIKVG